MYRSQTIPATDRLDEWLINDINVEEQCRNYVGTVHLNLLGPVNQRIGGFFYIGMKHASVLECAPGAELTRN